ncbi:VanW family protein [Heyndrickxia ginsengihumi]|uniref:VanW family protein n=1 Tax=Heyndrickxia ginsengihumi TaxID=363870 RepID=UPI003D23B7F6
MKKGFGMNDQFADGTSIGGVDISGMTKNEAQQKLEKSVQSWEKSSHITINYLDQSIKLPTSKLQFNIDESLNQARDGKASPLTVTLDSSNLMDEISNTFKSINLEDWNIARLNENICKVASNLQTGNHDYHLVDYAIDGDKKNKIVAKAELTSIPEDAQYDIAAWVKQFKQIKIPAQSAFSLLDVTKMDPAVTYSENDLSMIATTIYQAILTTNFEIIDRYISSELPSYAVLGEEAKVVPNKLDFVFINPNTSAYKLHFAYSNHTLSVSVVGTPFLEKYKILKKNYKTFSPKTVVHYNKTLKASQSVVLQAGKAGQYVKLYRKIYDQNHALLKSELISEDFYPSVPKIISKAYPEETTTDTAGTDQQSTDGNSEAQNTVTDSAQTNQQQHSDEKTSSNDSSSQKDKSADSASTDSAKSASVKADNSKDDKSGE